MIAVNTTRRPVALIVAWLLIAFGTVWIVANFAATAARLVNPMQTWQIRVNYDGATHPIDVCGMDSAAADAVKPRTIDMQRTSRDAVVRLLMGLAQEGHPNLSVTYIGEAQPETIVATPEKKCVVRMATRMLRSLGAVAMLALAAVLVVRLPSLPMLGFLLFMLGFSPMTQAALNSYLPSEVGIAQNLLNDVFEGAGLWGIALFCDGLGVRVATHDLHSRGNVLVRWLIALIAVAATACSMIADVRVEFYRQPANTIFVWSQVLVALGTLFAVALLFSTYFASNAKARARMRWICWSFAIGMSLYLIAYVSDNVPFIPLTLPDALVDILYLAIVLIPAAVTYALLRDHVMDVGLYVSRGTMYAVVIGAVIAIAEGVMAWAKPLLENIPVLTIFAAIFVVSFHPIIEGGTKKLAQWLAKDRIRAISDLRRSTRKFALVSTFAELETLMVRSAATSLKLAGAALVSEQRVIEKTDRYAAHTQELEDLASDLALREQLEATTAAVRIERSRYRAALAKFGDDIVPLAAIALENPGLPFHVFVVGPHEDGTDLDPEELEALSDFVERGLIAHVVMTLREIERRIGMPGSPLTE